MTEVDAPYLRLISEGTDRKIPLTNATSWTLGRGEDSAIVLRDKWASRNHAILQAMDSGNFFLIDLGSLNGSFVNGRRVTIPVALHHGDRITLGSTEMELLCPQASKPTKPQQPQRSTVMLHTRRSISVLVIDIRNFTGLTQQVEEQLLSQVIGSWFGQAGKIIQERGSWVDKYIGDAVMSVWVHASASEREDKPSSKLVRVPPNEILAVFRALNDLYGATDELNQRFELPFTLRIGAGINTGKAIVGQMGAGSHPEYTALGDTVNAAFRLESATKELGADIAIGETTYRSLGHYGELLPFQRHEVMLKGYTAAVAAYAGTFADLKAFLQQVEAMG